tara:strand:- start:641 stop:898 length:258 start_codon:yes stop_codon:yes gene_type:complete
MNDLHEVLADIEDFFTQKNIEIQIIQDEVKIYFEDKDEITLSIKDKIYLYTNNTNKELKTRSFKNVEDFFNTFDKLFLRSHLGKK